MVRAHILTKAAGSRCSGSTRFRRRGPMPDTRLRIRPPLTSGDRRPWQDRAAGRRSRRQGRSRAARALGMSYRRAGLLVEQINELLQEPAVTAATGGRQGGGAALTPSGERALSLSLHRRHRRSSPRRNSAPWASWCGSGARRAPDSPRRNSARLSYPGHFKMTVKVCGPLLPRVHPIDPSAPSSRPCSTGHRRAVKAGGTATDVNSYQRDRKVSMKLTRATFSRARSSR